jgi:hypothetical protein
MTNILDEIEQDLRKDRMKRIWQRYGIAIVTAAAILVLTVAGWRGWVAYEASRASQLGDRFLQAVQTGEAGNHDDAIRALEELARTGSGGYPVLARFRLATERAAKGEIETAVRGFDALANDASLTESWRDIARLRAAMLMVDSGSTAEVARRVERLTGGDNPFRHTAREIMGLAAYRAGDREAAARWFNALVTDSDAPEGARNRGSLVLTMLAADGVSPAQSGTR